jgi:hypothetical protein
MPADELQDAFNRFESAQARLDELSLVAHTLTRGVEIEQEPDDPASRAEFGDAMHKRDEALRDLKSLVQARHPQKENTNG